MTEKTAPKFYARPANENIIEFPQSGTMPLKGGINANELTSIKALTSYVAHNKCVPEDVVTAFVQAEFKVTSIADLRREDYERVIKFLVDLQVDLLIN